MSSLTAQQRELHFLFSFILRGYEDICDNLFFMRLELEAGEIPVFPPEPVFNPMQTIGKY
jgi:hypothetical protein